MRRALVSLALMLPLSAWAQTPPAFVPSTAQHTKSELCTPTDGAAELRMSEAFPEQGTAGHLAALRVKIVHGKGETLLPRGVQQDGDSAANKALGARGFRIPEPATDVDAGTTASVQREERDGEVTSTLTLPLVLLPKEPGTVHATLPPLPLSLVQASGQVVTVCTNPHEIKIVDPTANVPTPTPKDIPPPLRQREHWQALEWALYGLAAALVCAAVGAFSYRSWSRREKPVPPPPPPRPPWEIALEELRLLAAETSEPAQAIDRVTDVLRAYLGRTYGFDGLESTTEEVLANLRERGADRDVRAEVRRLLAESDLVKFAKSEAHQDAARATLEQTRQLVLATMPKATPAAAQHENKQEGAA